MSKLKLIFKIIKLIHKLGCKVEVNMSEDIINKKGYLDVIKIYKVGGKYYMLLEVGNDNYDVEDVNFKIN